MLYVKALACLAGMFSIFIVPVALLDGAHAGAVCAACALLFSIATVVAMQLELRPKPMATPNSVSSDLGALIKRKLAERPDEWVIVPPQREPVVRQQIIIPRRGVQLPSDGVRRIVVLPKTKK